MTAAAFFVFTDLLGVLAACAFLVPLVGFSFFGIARVGQLIPSTPHASQVTAVSGSYVRVENDVTPDIVLPAASGTSVPIATGSCSVPLRRVCMWMCLGALIPKRTRLRPTSRIVISTSSATTIFWSFLRLMISIGMYSYRATDRKQRTKNTTDFHHISVKGYSKFRIFLAQCRLLGMRKYAATTIALILLIFWPTMAQDIDGTTRASTPDRVHTQFEENYLKELDKRKRNPNFHGLYVESLDS